MKILEGGTARIKGKYYQECDLMIYNNNIHILSNESLNEGDWRVLVFETFDEIIETIIINTQFFGGNYKTISEKKIIATTEPLKINTFYEIEGNQELSLPHPSKEFVKNIHNGCKVLVEMEVRTDFVDAIDVPAYKLKINSNNEVKIIHHG